MIHFKKQPPEVFYKKAVLKNLATFTTRKHLQRNLFLMNGQTLKPAALLKRLFKYVYFKDHLQAAASASWSILYKEFVDISYENASFGILEDSIWLQLICFLTPVEFWPMKYVFWISCVVFIASLKSANMENSRHCMK